MDVHHHSNHNPDSHQKKKFKDYIVEFLMLFLAVTLGFFAESFREHIVEKRREKEYMKEIVENLKYDTIRCFRNAQNNIKRTAGMDSLRTELKEAIHGRINGNKLYYFAIQYLGDVGIAVFNTSAITELKNSGSLRLIRNRQLVGELADYYERKITAAQFELPTQAQRDDLQKKENGIFSLQGLDDYLQTYDHIDKLSSGSNYDYQKMLNRSPSLSLLNKDPVTLETFYTQLSWHEIQIKRYDFWLATCQAAAEKLIIDIQKQYHLN